ncbi:alpha-N-acetylglucosaminidase TIM-barrel domain-containing protein, partial [Streptomyces sp. NPDC051098]|uniref:alpha-N-acetylglucosaminidase TIM-barrel domain-containing protein n=1 Tax=Streptomyces sp. NPDC051098 TaxID=3155411 RepID=UPI003443EAC5
MPRPRPLHRSVQGPVSRGPGPERTEDVSADQRSPPATPGRPLAAVGRRAGSRRIADRMRELGMHPVLPGYFGTVPDGFVARNPG